MTMLYILGGFIGFGVVAFLFWPYIEKWFADSETIFFARLQLAIGAVLQVIFSLDLMPVFEVAGLGDYFPVWLVGSGIATELLRRHRSTDLK